MCMHWDKSHVSFSPQFWPAFSDFSHQDVLAMLCCGEIILYVACTHKQSKKNVQVGFVFQVFNTWSFTAEVWDQLAHNIAFVEKYVSGQLLINGILFTNKVAMMVLIVR